MITVYLFRHGITFGNEQRLYYGSTDLSLSEKGREAVLERKEAGMYPDPTGFEVITSALIRTQETAKLVYGDISFISDKRLNEADFGDFEMKSYEQLKDDPDFNIWISGDNWNNICPNGESGKIMMDRARTAFSEYLCKDSIIFCHGGIIASFMMEWFPGLRDNFYEWQPKPCEGYKVIFDEHGSPVDYLEIKR